MVYPYTAVITTLAVFGALTNSFCAGLMRRHRVQLATESLGYFINQSLLDLTAALLLLLSNFNLGQHITIGDAGGLDPDSHWHDFLCKVWISELPVWSTLMSSTCNLIILTVDRYLGVVHPLWHRKVMTSRKLKVLHVIPWLSGPIYHTMFLNASRIVNGRCIWNSFYPNIGIARTVASLKLIFEFFGPVAIMVFCYGSIWFVLRRRKRRVAAATQNLLSRADMSPRIAILNGSNQEEGIQLVSTEMVHNASGSCCNQAVSNLEHGTGSSNPVFSTLEQNVGSLNPAIVGTEEGIVESKYGSHLTIPSTPELEDETKPGMRAAQPKHEDLHHPSNNKTVTAPHRPSSMISSAPHSPSNTTSIVTHCHSNTTLMTIHHPSHKASIRVDKSVIKTAATICLVYVCCWITKDLILFLTWAFQVNIVGTNPKTSPVFAFALTSLFMQCCINPFIYILQLSAVRKFAKKDMITIRDKLCCHSNTVTCQY